MKYLLFVAIFVAVYVPIRRAIRAFMERGGKK